MAFGSTTSSRERKAYRVMNCAGIRVSEGRGWGRDSEIPLNGDRLNQFVVKTDGAFKFTAARPP